ncbi:MAG: uroporphyrinogen-III synthase [Thermoleophilia bacterium]|nr:uroporphyrinogen-III synthase [Thermoleophilia bacterium]
MPLRELGAEVILAPVIRIVPRSLDEEARRVLAGVATYDLLVFTSVNGVRIFADDLDEAGPGLSALKAPGRRPVLAAIGPATAAALEARGLACDVVPEDYVAEGLLAALERRGVAPAGARVLIPRAAEARSVLPDTLRGRGASVDLLPVYDTLAVDGLEVPCERLGRADFITFTSSSTVRAFVDLFAREARAGDAPAAAGDVARAGNASAEIGDVPRAGHAGAAAGDAARADAVSRAGDVATRVADRLAGVALCSIGPVTSATLRECGLPVAIEAREYTTAGLIAAIVDAASV